MLFLLLVVVVVIVLQYVSSYSFILYQSQFNNYSHHAKMYLHDDSKQVNTS